MASLSSIPPIALAQFKSTRKGPWTRFHLLSLTVHGDAVRCEPLNGKTIQPLGPEPSLLAPGWSCLTPLDILTETGAVLKTAIRVYNGPGVRVAGYSDPVPIIHVRDQKGVFEVGRKPNFLVAVPAPASPSPLTDAEVTMATDPHLLFSGTPEPAPAPTSVFLLKKSPTIGTTYTDGYLLVGEYHHTADIYCYKLLPPGEDVILSFMMAPDILEYYHVKGISTDKKVVRDLRFVRNPYVNATRASTGEHLRVYDLPLPHVREHVGLRLKRNFNAIVAAPAPLYDVSGAAAAGAGSGMPPPPMVMDASGAAVPITVDTISHVSAPPPPPLTTTTAKGKVIKKLKSKYVSISASSATSSRGDLCPFVARQLLELAQMRKELCPVVAEEFSTGNTAVMPCGHLFAQIAIEESFKKEPNRCPACRQSGRPTYV